ncbi:MAG: ECF transporter S component [Oscillospiraceae bacterium]
MKKFTVRDLAEIGVLAALVFVATYFIKIGPIPTPAGPTMLKTGNAVCLIGAILFGKVKGGLAAGIGSMLYDLTDPAFVASAPFTLVFFFAMAFVCGLVSHIGGNKGENVKQDVIGAACGALTYLVLHIGKSYITLVISGSGAAAALTACATKLITSGFNAIFAVVVAAILSPIFCKALSKRYRVE